MNIVIAIIAVMFFGGCFLGNIKELWHIIRNKK